MTEISVINDIDIIAFDADDTLWHNESIFYSTHDRFKALLSKYHDEAWIADRLYKTESRNILHFGYGVKGFTLSMIETAIELSEGRITATEIQNLIEIGKEMMNAPVELLDGVYESVATLAQSYELMLITKGDLFHQEAKIARSGLGDFFSRIEVVSEKEQRVYERIIRKHHIAPQHFVMIGNSLKSDILPVVAIGGIAIHIPYKTEWIHERVSENELTGKHFLTVEHISHLPNLFSK
ncbi:MAG: HAD family hydrolase [Acidobacteriota bacterium]